MALVRVTNIVWECEEADASADCGLPLETTLHFESLPADITRAQLVELVHLQLHTNYNFQANSFDCQIIGENIASGNRSPSLAESLLNPVYTDAMLRMIESAAPSQTAELTSSVQPPAPTNPLVRSEAWRDQMTRLARAGIIEQTRRRHTGAWPTPPRGAPWYQPGRAGGPTIGPGSTAEATASEEEMAQFLRRLGAGAGGAGATVATGVSAGGGGGSVSRVEPDFFADRAECKIGSIVLYFSPLVSLRGFHGCPVCSSEASLLRYSAWLQERESGVVLDCTQCGVQVTGDATSFFLRLGEQKMAIDVAVLNKKPQREFMLFAEELFRWKNGIGGKKKSKQTVIVAPQPEEPDGQDSNS